MDTPQMLTCPSKLAYELNRMLTNSGFPGLFRLKDDDGEPHVEMVMRHVKVRITIGEQGIIPEVYVMVDDDNCLLNKEYNCYNVRGIWESIIKFNVSSTTFKSINIKRIQNPHHKVGKLIIVDLFDEPFCVPTLVGAAAAMAVMIATNDLKRGY